MIEALISSILPRTDLSASSKLVMIELATKQAKRNYCKVSIGYMALRTGLARSTVKRAVVELIAARAITCKRHKIAADENDVNSYSVVWLNNYHRRANHLKRINEAVA